MRIACAMAALIIALSGCAAQPVTPTTKCTEPRPQVCTREYAPACAVMRSGERKEFATGCTACSDEQTVGYVPGPCPGE